MILVMMSILGISGNITHSSLNTIQHGLTEESDYFSGIPCSMCQFKAISTQGSSMISNFGFTGYVMF